MPWRCPDHGPDHVGRLILSITTTPTTLTLLTMNGSTGLAPSHDGGLHAPISLTTGTGADASTSSSNPTSSRRGATSAQQLLPKAEHAAAPAEPTVGVGPAGVLSSAA